MDSFEEAFDNATKVADVALKANQDLSKQLRGLRKASKDWKYHSGQEGAKQAYRGLGRTNRSRQQRRRRVALRR